MQLFQPITKNNENKDKIGETHSNRLRKFSTENALKGYDRE